MGETDDVGHCLDFGRQSLEARGLDPGAAGLDHAARLFSRGAGAADPGRTGWLFAWVVRGTLYHTARCGADRAKRDHDRRGGRPVLMSSLLFRRAPNPQH